MKTTFARISIVVLVVIELIWFVYPRHGSDMGDRYRNRERIEALRQYGENPSPATWAVVEKEFALLNRRLAYRHIALFTLFLVLDGVLIFYFWNFGAKRGLKSLN